MVQSIDEQLNTITQDVTDTYTALEAKGATLPAKKGTSNLKATVDSLPKSGFPYQIYSVDANGTTVKPTQVLDKNTFADIVEIRGYCLDSFFAANQYARGYVCFPNLKYVYQDNFNNFDSKDNYAWNDRYIDKDSFPNLISVAGGAMKSFKVKPKGDLEFPKLQYIRGGDFLFYGVTTDKPFVVKMNALTRVDEYSLREAFAYSSIKEFICDNLEEFTEDVYFKPFRSAFSNCKSLTRVSFAKLKAFRFDATFLSCTALTELSFPSLESADLKSFASSCSKLTNVSLPKLTTMLGNWSYAFKGCTSLATISFPSLTTFKFNSSSNTFSGCTALTEIHFRADMQATVEALSGYASKWGATNATIYFDL